MEMSWVELCQELGSVCCNLCTTFCFMGNYIYLMIEEWCVLNLSQFIIMWWGECLLGYDCHTLTKHYIFGKTYLLKLTLCYIVFKTRFFFFPTGAGASVSGSSDSGGRYNSGGGIDIEYSGHHFVAVGGKFSITCITTVDVYPQWTFNGNAVIPGEAG